MGARKEWGIYPRGNRYYISYYFNGKHIRKGGFQSKGEAKKELTAIRAKIDNRTFVPPRSDSFDGLVDEYDALQAKKAGYASEQYYIGRVREYFKGHTVQEISFEDVEKFRDYLVDLPVKGGGQRGTVDINHHMGCLYSILKKAVLRDWIVKNPADAERVKRPAKGNGRTQYLKVDEAGRLLEACPPHLYSIVLCQLETGMRPGEAKGLRWSEVKDVPVEDGKGGTYTATMIFLPAERTKTREARKIPVSARLKAHLDMLKEAQKSQKVVSFSDLVFRFHETRRVWNKAEGKMHLVTGPLKSNRTAWSTALEKADLNSGLHIHDLRRTFRSHMKKAGVDTFTLNEIMGHANPKIEKVYTQLDDDHLIRAMSHIPDWNSHKTSTPLPEQEKRATL